MEHKYSGKGRGESSVGMEIHRGEERDMEVATARDPEVLRALRRLEKAGAHLTEAINTAENKLQPIMRGANLSDEVAEKESWETDLARKIAEEAERVLWQAEKLFQLIGRTEI